MSNLVLKSAREIQAQILSKIITQLGLTDINPGSVLDILTRALADELFAQEIQMSQIVRLIDIDYMFGEDLDNYAFAFGLTRKAAVKSNGLISIFRESGFEKVNTTFYAGFAAPIEGNSVIYVNNASSPLYGTSGSLILGRGTSNEEEVSYSTQPINNINYYTINLDAPLSNNHIIEESIVLKQGTNYLIAAGTIVEAPANSVSEAIQFVLDNDVILYSGESVVENVSITASKPGILGNISINSISGVKAFPNPPFSGARAYNTTKFTTGLDNESDQSLRDRIRSHIQGMSKGTKQAILDAIIGLVDEETAKRVVSASVVLPQDTITPVKVYIDDGIGFEPSFDNVGQEDVISNAVGSETRLQLDEIPILKAQLETSLSEPYDLDFSLPTLTVEVGLDSETITFAASDFVFPNTALAKEVVTAINNRSTLFEARTSQNGTKIVINAINDTNETITVIGGSANSVLSFPTETKSTLYLYKNDLLLNKDGSTAYLDNNNISPFNLSAIGTFPLTLTLIIDNKTANPQTITFQSGDFSIPSAATTQEIVAVINNQLCGAISQSIDNNTRIRLISNTKLSESSSIEVTGGTINDAVNGLNFNTTLIKGTNGDYTLNRELGTILLSQPLSSNDTITAGSLNTRAQLIASLPENYSPNDGSTLIITVDGMSSQTVTFDNSFTSGVSGQLIANYINYYLKGGTAKVRKIGNNNYLEIISNTYDVGFGSIELDSASTANVFFGFSTDQTKLNQRSHTAYVVNSITEPYSFAQDENLVLVIDNDIVNNTYSIPMSYSSSISSVVSTTQFNVSNFINIFKTDKSLLDCHLAFISGSNTLDGDIISVSNVSGNIWRYTFDSIPSGLGDYQIGDLVKFEDMIENGNNGNFVILDINDIGTAYLDIYNISGAIESSSSGVVKLSQKRTITSYDHLTGNLIVDNAFTNLPVHGDSLIVLPQTIENLVDYFNNIKITSLSLKSSIESCLEANYLQISSKSNGAFGYVQITGGLANGKLGFTINQVRGLSGYEYYTGLTSKVHKTIYGDDQDLVTYPGVGAAGIQIQVLAPTVTNISVDLTITLKDGISLNQVTNEVQSVISGYINNLGIGPAGLGGRTTALAVNVEVYPTHIAGLPVAVNINCHATRHAEIEF